MQKHAYSFLLLTVAFVHLYTVTSAQTISLSVRQLPLKKVFTIIKQQTGYAVLANRGDMEGTQPVSISVHQVPLPDFMNLLLKDQPLKYTIEGKTIFLSRKLPSLPKLPGTFSGPDTTNGIAISGKVSDAAGKPIPGATIIVKGTTQGTVTDPEGYFVLSNVTTNALLLVRSIGYQPLEILTDQKNELHPFNITLNFLPKELATVEAIVSTGYQQLPEERATGSFVLLNNKLINRSVSTDILSRLDGVTSGVYFNKPANRIGGNPNNGGDPDISIRGRSTLFANTSPLIVLDNFPYEGDPANINPNDIESVTVLKDAAAASIWGVRAGNGVIVYTSKKGKLNQRPTVSFNTNLTLGRKPDVFAIPQMSSADYIQFEKYLFNNGKYDFFLTYLPYYTQSPVVDILDKEKNGLIGHDEAASQLAALASNDVRRDYSKYFLREQVNQQYSLSVSGGTSNNQYYISGGFDRNLSSLVSDAYNRFTLNARNVSRMFNDKLELSADLFFTKSTNQTNPQLYNFQYPYEQLVDKNGDGLPVIRDYRQASKDALSDKGLPDWNYYPFNERKNNDNRTGSTDYRINIALRYNIYKDIFSLTGNYQYQQGNIDQTILYDQNTYYTRLIINKFAQIDPSGTITYPVPLGSVYNIVNTDYKSNTGRIQLNYHQLFNKRHEVNFLAGFEVKDYNSYTLNTNLFGYNSDNATSIPVDYFSDFTTTIDGGITRIPNIYGQSGITDRFISYYANGSYTLDDKYILSASVRRDESNLFGVDANQKGVPLYSLGMSWNISGEQFYKIAFLPYLRFRVTDGYNGNLSKNLSAYTTAKAYNTNMYNAPTQSIVNPPNPSLSWEKVNVINAALDFSTVKNRLSGSIEFYIKNGKNLLGNSPVAGQTGVIQFTGNTANLKTKGFDVTLNSINTSGAFSWTTNFLLTHVKDRVTEYKLQTGTNSNYVTSNFSNPMVGRPYASIFAYPSAGLDNTGNPQGFLDGKISTDYAGILNSTDLTQLKFMGSATPTTFGSLRNNFSYRNLDLSFNIIYKLGYYFRRGSFNSSSSSFQQADYEKRWQKPGDELTTSVPALSYPSDPQRDLFYNGSEVLVSKADHIRLQDCQVGYTFKFSSRSFFKGLRVYGYMNNIGIIWKANKEGLDPDYVGGGFYSIPNPRSYSLGVNVNL